MKKRFRDEQPGYMTFIASPESEVTSVRGSELLSIAEMGKRCCIYGCNYTAGPTSKKSFIERGKWLKTIKVQS